MESREQKTKMAEDFSEELYNEYLTLVIKYFQNISEYSDWLGFIWIVGILKGFCFKATRGGQ